jgi:hypothetical protein
MERGVLANRRSGSQFLPSRSSEGYIQRKYFLFRQGAKAGFRVNLAGRPNARLSQRADGQAHLTEAEYTSAVNRPESAARNSGPKQRPETAARNSGSKQRLETAA